MEKKTTQRIIGILVAVSMVIILLPLLFEKNEAATQTSSVKAPPFPDQVTEPAKVAQAAPSTSFDISPEMADKINHNATQFAANTPKPQPDVKPVEAVVAKGQPVPVAAPVVKELPPTDSAAPKYSVITDTASAVKAKMQTKVVTAKKSSIRNSNKHVKSVMASKSDKQSLEKLKKSAWVVQLGSFKNKANARRLADRLRTAGYRAFMRDMKSAKGNASTRVYIGPEFKQASAMKISSKLEQQMKLRGMVLTYKPLEL